MNINGKENKFTRSNDVQINMNVYFMEKYYQFNLTCPLSPIHEVYCDIHHIEGRYSTVQKSPCSDVSLHQMDQIPHAVLKSI